jgi:hypothetical protein
MYEVKRRDELSGLQEASDQPVSIPSFGGFGAHPFGVDRCVGPAHEHGLCRLQSGSDLLVKRSTGAQLGVEPDIRFEVGERAGDNLHRLALFLLVANEDVHQSGPSLRCNFPLKCSCCNT